MCKTALTCFLVAVCLWHFRPALANESDACMAAVARLDAFLLAQPAACETAADCGGYYYRADPCADAAVLPKAGAMEQGFMMKLVQLQMEARGLCMKIWEKRPACSPAPFKAACVKNKCVDAAAP